MRYFQENSCTFGRAYDEDTDRVFQMCDTISITCSLTSPEKSLAMIFMLRGNALHFFN